MAETDPQWLWPMRENERQVGRLLATIAAEEERIQKLEPPDGCFGWLPYPLAGFITYMTDAVREAPGPRFLDVGCGPGTKLIVAEALFDLQCAGIEIIPAYVSQARARGLRVARADARTFPSYGYADIVYINKPVEPQEPFERFVMQNMRQGAILVSVNGHLLPSQEKGWAIVAEEADEPVRGAWMKL